MALKRLSGGLDLAFLSFHKSSWNFLLATLCLIYSLFYTEFDNLMT